MRAALGWQTRGERGLDGEKGGRAANKLKSVSLIRSTLSPNKRQSPTPSLKLDDCRPAAGFSTYVRVYVATAAPTPVLANRLRGRRTRPCEATTPRQNVCLCALPCTYIKGCAERGRTERSFRGCGDWEAKSERERERERERASPPLPRPGRS